jgi:hypothetical protein
MIIRENKVYPDGVIYFMTDTAILAASVKSELLEIAKQALALGTGLQNAAPGDKSGGPNNSVSYLLSIAENLAKLAEECGKIQSNPAST